MKIDIVSHCYAMKYEHYSAALDFQLSSFVFHPPKDCQVTATICYCPRDTLTQKVIDWFSLHTSLALRLIHLDPSRLGRRAIGRNLAAKGTQADIVWFADVDQVYDEGCLDRLAAMEWADDTVMIYPKDIKIHRNHAIGDVALNRARSTWDGDHRIAVEGEIGYLIEVDKNDFIDKHYSTAIGGVQIIKGFFARAYGYLDNHPKWQKPTDGSFAACKCDVAYRKFCKRLGKVVGVDLPGMYRLRHSQAGHGRTPKL